MTDQGKRPEKGQVDCESSVSRPVGVAVSLAVVAALGAGPVSAEVKYDIGATSQYQYNTNVFDLPAGGGIAGFPASERADSYVTYGAQGNVDYLVGDQDFFVRGSATDFRYQHFTELTHYEYLADGGLNFKLGTQWDGTLEVLRNRLQVAFADLNQQSLSLQTDQKESGKLRFLFLPDWRIGISGYTHDLTEPTVFSPNLKLEESSGASTLEYLGVSNLTAGVTGTYLSGTFSGNTGVDSRFDSNYDEVDEQVIATYKLSGLSSINMKAGYSNRTSVLAADSLSGFTGLLAFNEQFTTKTKMTVSASRVIQSYVANLGSEIDTIGHIDATWQATFKTGLTLAYEYTYRDYPDQGLGGGARLDHVQYASVGIDYEPTRWLAIKPYANFTTRHSNVDQYEFSGNIYGVNVLVHMMGD